MKKCKFPKHFVDSGQMQDQPIFYITKKILTEY